MSLPLKQKKSQSPWLDLAIFTCVLVFLGYSVHVALLSFARHGNEKQTLPSAPATLSASPPLKRAPAATEIAAKLGAATEVLRIPCLHQAARKFTSEANLLQIHAPACDEDILSANGWKAANESSGEEIMIFVNSKEKTLSTSYFRLKEGVNRLVFTHELGSGAAKVQKLEVVSRSVGAD